MSTQKAEKAAHQKPQPTKDSLKELDEGVVTFLRTRMEWGRQISHLQAKLQGKAQEMEAMDCYLRSQPRLGRKRKQREVAATATVAVADDPQNPAVSNLTVPAVVNDGAQPATA